MAEVNESDNFEAQQPQKAQTRDEKKLAKYDEDMKGFSVANNSNITDGCVKERRVTDFGCLVVFLVFLGAMIGCTLYGFKKGDVAKYIAPLDGQDNFCGIDANYKDYPKMFLTSLSGSPSTIFSSGVCVKACPKSKTDTIECAPSGTNFPYDDCSTASVYDTHTTMGYCFPDMGALKRDYPDLYDSWKLAFETMLTSNPAGQQFQDMYNSSNAIYTSMAMSFVYCMVYIYLLSAFAEPIAWALIVVVQLGLISGAGFFVTEYLAMKSGTVSNQNEGGMLAAAVVFSILSCIFALAVYCGFQSLRIAINVIDAAADFLAKTKRIIGVPILYFFVTVIFVSIWLGCMMCINTIGVITADTSTIIQKKDVYRNDAEDKVFLYLFLFMFFGILWICAFIRAKTSFITMVAACTYYFDSNEEKDGSADVGTGFYYAYMKHAGSLAFGSFIIALIQFIRIVVMTVAEQAQRASGDNQAVKIIVGCANCMLKCIEKICDYINQAAYAYMAVSGDSFCTSAWNGFLLNMKHGLKFAWANFLAGAFIVLGKIGLVFLNCFSCYMIMKHVTKDLDEISSIAAPLFVVAVVTYMSASLFLGMFDEAVLALMTCLAIDVDLNGSPKYGPPTFHDSLDSFDKPVNKNAIQDGGYEKVEGNNTMA